MKGGIFNNKNMALILVTAICLIVNTLVFKVIVENYAMQPQSSMIFY